MASSDSNRNHGDQLEEDKEEEEEEEYEEVEEEVEVEEEEEEFEEVEEEEEVEEYEEEFEVEEEVEEGKHEAGEEEEGVNEEIQEGKQEVGEEEVEEEEEEEEYEEIEEEEYEEVEEEVTDEEDETMAEAEFDDKGSANVNCAATSLSVPFTADNMCKDASQDVKTEANIVHDAHAAEMLCPDEGSSSPKQMNDDGKVISSIDLRISKSPKLHEHVTAPLDNGSDSVEDKQGHVKETVMVSASEKHASAPEAASDELGKMDTTDVDESKLLSEEADLHFPSRESIDQKESRVRPRSSSPGVECQDGNKRAAIICEFFAKGWCIKGSSCRFLHKREHVDNATQVGDKLSAESELRPDKGCGDDADASGSTAGKDILMEHGNGLKLAKYEDKEKIALLEKTVSSSFVSADSQKSSFHKDGSRTLSNSRVEAEVLKENHLFDNLDSSVFEGGSMLRQNFFPRCGSSMRELGLASGSESILKLVEESAAMRRRYSLDFQSSVPSYHFSSWKSTSLLHKSPLLSGSDPTTISGNSYAQDQPISFNYKTTFTPYNWEPSVPFRSSYFIPPVKRSADIQYDPFRDSIEQPNVEHASFKNSYGNTQDVQSISGRNSLELHKGLQLDSWGKNYSVHDKVIPEVEAESAATSASDVQNKKIIEEENPMVPGSVKDILKASRNINDGNSKLQSDLLRNGEMKVNGRQPNELDDEESKAIKYFRAALIEFVKELMKPIWHEGRLSKDVYKVIVQKAEDKILSTLQPNQVPSSSESIKQYLSSSRPKILKLIQAYVDKYGKF